MPIIQPLLYLVTIVLCNVHGNLEHEVPRRSFLSRRAIDGTRGRKYFDPEEEGSFDSYGSAGGQYDRYKDKQDHSDIRMNVPGEPGTDYPAYTTLPQTGFSCEGRSRGYYADEAAGCQVFHVCHDILISSFLCPIGSIFSQKLLTCDWWSKVDCSTTRKFIEVNRDGHYQEDDDELIRKAYGMMGLQTGTNVASDELVDPDRGGRIIDYVTIDSTGNDLAAYRNDLPRTKTPQFLSTYGEHSERASPTYPNTFYSKNYHARPYKDSPIIRIEKIGEENYREPSKYDYQDIREKSGKRINEFQPSYAPTVPTVTTTTRRLYSPTIPTTYRPSTLVYNGFDQAIESSDHLYAHSQESRNIFALSTPSDKNSKVTYNDNNPQGGGNDNEDRDRDRSKDDPSFRVRPTFVGEEYNDGIEIKEGIDVDRAFNASNKFRIHVRDHVDDAKYKSEDDSSSLRSNRDNATESLGNSEESVDQWQTETTDTLEYTSIFEKGTTPVIEYLSRFKVKDNDTEIEEPSTTTLSYEENLTSTETATIPLDEKLYSTEKSRIIDDDDDDFDDDSESGTNIDSTILQPEIVLKPPVFTGGNFRISVPDYPSTQIPVFHTSHHRTHSEEGTTTEVPTNERLVETTNVSLPWFHRTTDLPARDIEPPFVDSKDDNVDEIVTQSSIFDTVVRTVSTKDTSIYSRGEKVDDKIRRNSREPEEMKFVNESIKIFERDARPEIVDSSTSLRYIEDAIERNNSPYQVSVTLNKKDESVPIKDDLIVSLIERHQRNGSSPDRLGQIEIVKSIEGITETADKKLPSNDTIDLSSNQKKVESGVGSSNVNALSLLQLMAELLKIDHIPRPFSLNNQQGVKSNLRSNWDKKELSSATIKSIHDSSQREKIVESVPFDSDKKNDMPRPRDILKDRLSYEPTNDYDRPLNDTKNRLPIYRLPQIQRSLDFEEFKEFGNPSTILPPSTTSFPKTTDVIESVKTVVETEFVPSIGFSFDTNEGRKKYIEAILGGLLNEPIHENSTNESFNVESIEGSPDN